MAHEAHKVNGGGTNVTRTQVDRINAHGWAKQGSGRPIYEQNIALRSNRTSRETGQQVRRIAESINNRTDLTEQEKYDRLNRLGAAMQRVQMGLEATGRGYAGRYDARNIEFPNTANFRTTRTAGMTIRVSMARRNNR